MLQKQHFKQHSNTETVGEEKVKFADKDFDPETGICEFVFGNGTKLEVNVKELNPEIQSRLMFHGALQKIGDSYASAKGDYAKAIENARGVIEQLQSGSWRAARGESEGKPRVAELSAAIARLKGITLEEATSAVQAAVDMGEAGAEKIKGWRNHPRIKAAIAALRAEKAQADLERNAQNVPDFQV